MPDGESTPLMALGIVAGVLTTGAAVPQLYKIFVSRRGKDLSYVTMLMSIVGISLWIAYAHIKGLTTVLAWNCVALLFALTMLGLKAGYCTDGGLMRNQTAAHEAKGRV
jgi:MtN3 and saliva related transmembrane protein